MCKIAAKNPLNAENSCRFRVRYSKVCAAEKIFVFLPKTLDKAEKQVYNIGESQRKSNF